MLEGLTSLGGAYLAHLTLGLGVEGAVWASVFAVIASYLLAKPSPGLQSLALARISDFLRRGLQAIVFFSGQVVINNFDIVLVKHFFASEEAGIYAAVSLVGRLVNMCAWSVVNTMFPVSAGLVPSDREARPGAVHVAAPGVSDFVCSDPGSLGDPELSLEDTIWFAF